MWQKILSAIVGSLPYNTECREMTAAVNRTAFLLLCSFFAQTRNKLSLQEIHTQKAKPADSVLGL